MQATTQATSALSDKPTSPELSLHGNSATTNSSRPPKKNIVLFKYHNVQFKAELASTLPAIYCKKDHLINEIVQCPDGDLLCRQCLVHEQQTQITKQLRCPKHHTGVFEDKFIARDIKSDHPGKCPSNTTYKNSRCPWHGPIDEILDHLDTCSNIPPKDWKTMMQYGRAEDAKTIKKLTNVVAELKSKIQEQNSSASLLPGIQQSLYDLEKRSAANTCLIGSLQNEISTLQFKIDTLQLKGVASENLPLSSLEPLDEAASPVVNSESRTSLVNPPGLPATTRTLAVDTDFIGPTPDGCWIWRIDNFEHKRSEAQVFEEKRVIHSPEFNTRSGYKMRTRIYLDGDGNGRKTHISLFISLLKGKFDAALRWPLSVDVSFMIIDQLKGSHEIETGHLKFQRPIGDEKSFVGFPCILRLTNLEHGYVVDDTMFIKIFIKD